MSAVLRERFSEPHAILRAAQLGVALHRVNIFIHSMMRPQPLALTCMCRKHRGLSLHAAGYRR